MATLARSGSAPLKKGHAGPAHPRNPLRIGTVARFAMAQAMKNRARLACRFEIPQAAFEIVGDQR